MKPNTVPFNSHLNARLTAYAAVAAAAVGTAITATPAQADVIWSGPISINIPSTTTGVYLNVVTGVNSPTASLVTSWDVNPWSSSGLGLFNPAAPSGGAYVASASGGTVALNLAMGTLISSSSLFGSNSSVAGNSAQFNLNSSNNLIGFRFVDPSIGGGATVLYGWMRISLGATAGGQPRAIAEYAYDNTGAGLSAGVVPEPTTMALFSVMAVGALGVQAWRKRKAA